jgi:hypothetical protein
VAWNFQAFAQLAPADLRRVYPDAFYLQIEGGASSARGAFVKPLYRIPFAATLFIFLCFIGVGSYSGGAGSISGDYLEFTLEGASTGAVEEIILRDLASRASLISQRAFVTIPVLSTETPVRVLSAFAGRDLKSIVPKISLNREYFLARAQRESGLAAFGGMTLYGANIYGYTADETRAFIERLKTIYSTHILVHFRRAGGAQQDFTVVIRPIIGLDCEFSPSEFRYCRNVKEQFAGLRPGEELHRRIADELVRMGVDTPLSPEIDLRPGAAGPADSIAMTAATRNIVGTLSAHRLIPVAKHFLYDRSADPHEQEVHVGTPLDQYPLWLAPYAAMEASGAPYFIMVTHHSLLLDPGVPSPLSPAVKNLIRTRFPHAVIMADDVRMRGLPREHGISGTIANLKTDAFLFHIGNITPQVTPVIEGLIHSRGPESEEAVYRLLHLKQQMGMVTISPIYATAAKGDASRPAARDAATGG